MYSPLNSFGYWTLNKDYYLLVQLNKCVVLCGSVLQMGHNGNGCSSILFKYESRVGNLFVLSWARVRRVALGSVVSE